MQHFASITALVLAAIMASSAAPLPTDQEMMARDCEVKTNTGGLSRRCVRWINAGLVAGDPAKRDSVGIANGDHDLTATFQGAQLPSLISARDSVGIANDDYDVKASFQGARLPSVISARSGDTNIGVGNDATNSDLDFSGVDFSGLTIKAKRGDVGILNDATGDYNFKGATFGDIIGSEHVNRRGDVGILNGASGDYDFDGATFGPIIGSEHVNRRGDGDVGVKNGATGGGDYSNTVWGPQVGDRYIGYSTVSRRDDGDVGVKNGATGGGDYSNTVWGPQVGDRYIGYSTVSKRDGNNDADPCPGVPVGPSVGTTYMPTHPSTNNKRCSSTPIPPTDGGIVYTRRSDDPPQLVSPQQKADAEAQGPAAVKQLKNQAGAEGSQIAVDRTQDALSAAGMKRDGNNDADPCPGVPVGPSVGTTYMPTHPSTNNKRCSSTPIAPTDGGIVYTRDSS